MAMGWKRMLACLGVVASMLLGANVQGQTDGKNAPGLVLSEFVFEKGPTPQCHATTMAETKSGLVAAWFAGTREKNKDVGIWVARRGARGWSQPVEVANGVQSDGSRHPCWNPVLFQPSTGGNLQLYYKVGPSPQSWWCMVMTSSDGGKTWSQPRRLPDGIIGPVRNKIVELGNGKLLSPSSTEHDGWTIHFEHSSDGGKTWSATPPVNDAKKFGLIQPAILQHKDGTLQALCRSRQRFIVETFSKDGGKTWSPPQATTLRNPNSGIDAGTLKDGRFVLIYNRTPLGRTPLNVAISKDGKEWQDVFVLEKTAGEYSYPCVLQTSDGLVHISYTWRRLRVKHVVLDPSKLAAVK